ncbi:helix-turn-helix transcriptional regulator [uncultured Ruminococcus sp.]|uniref:helix-turn-helix domain-containing protein n=1 Tax=uncultured Ruminococcus sp. TaxID=165186 RepID=UPI002930E571|nr:helix-turn-helix transcriptional regulator [uncultured Ruminococcus sp.]
MEFSEKLQQLRKSKGLTQEELAQAIFVSRTAVSKWESGRGYPNIDSLKALAKFFSVTVDELLSTDEIITAAEEEKQELIGQYTSLLCHVMDVFTALLLFIPVFGNGADKRSVSFFSLTDTPHWIKIIYAVVISLTVLNGVCGLIISRLDKPLWSKHRLITGLALSVIACLLFMITRQPYAGVFCFAILIIKGWIFIRRKTCITR